MSKVKIELANLSDVNVIAVLGAVTFYEAYFEQDESKNLADYIVESFSPQQIEDELKNSNSTFFIAYSNHKAVGYAKLRENSKVECLTSENAIEIQRIYTLPKVYGSGVGASLLERCLNEGKRKGRDTIWLSVWEANLRAQRFYEKQGFQKVGTSTFLYGDEVGINFVMEKKLK